MRGIKTNGRQISESAGRLALVCRADGIAAILDQPEIVFSDELHYRGQVERIAERVGEHHCTGFVRTRFLQLTDINVIGRYGDVDEYGHELVLNDGIYRGGEACRDCNDFIAAFQAAGA